MTFLHPAFLAAGVAIGLPVLVHFLTRPRPVRMPLSTVRFVLKAVQQRRARHRLRDALVLLLRIAAVALLVWAFARPLTGEKPLVAAAAEGDGARVVVLDQSASMGATVRGVSAFEKARPVAGEFLSPGGGTRANLILAAAVPRAAFDSPTANAGALRDELRGAAVRPERLDAQAAINLAARMLAAAPQGHRRELVIVSDFQRGNWAAADFSSLPQDTKIELKSVADGDPANAAGRANVGILRVGMPGRVEQHREARVEIEVGNYSPAAREVTVELALGKGTYRVSGLCPPGLTTTLWTNVTPTEAGWQTGEARLIGVEDALKADDRRAVVLEVRPSPTFVLVTRESARPQATSSHFVERALAPAVLRQGQTVRGGARVVRVSPDKLDRDALAPADLVVVDHPGRLSAPAANLLAGAMRRGRAVLYVAAETVDATNLKLIADAAGGDMKMPVEFLPPGAGQVRRGLFLAEMRKGEAPFAVFGDSAGAAVGPLRFGGGLASRRLESGLADDVLAGFGDRSAAVVVTPCGAGALGVFNADLTASTLPSSGAFVPLFSELVGRLTGTRAGRGAVNSGEPATALLPPDAGGAAGLAVEQGDSGAALVDDNGAVAWRWPAAGAPGVYRATRGGSTVFAMATGVAREESDLRAMDAAVMQRLAAGRAVHFDSAAAAGGGQDQKDRAWAWVLVACCACMIVELGVLKAFRT